MANKNTSQKVGIGQIMKKTSEIVPRVREMGQTENWAYEVEARKAIEKTIWEATTIGL